MHYTLGVKRATSALKLTTGMPSAIGETRKRITSWMSLRMKFEAPKISNFGSRTLAGLAFPASLACLMQLPLEPIEALEEIEHFGYTAPREGFMPT